MNISKLFDVSNKVVIITGATGNLGAEYVKGFSQAGANVVIADLEFKNCKKLADEIKEKYDVDPLPIKLDLNNKKSINLMIKKTILKYSKIDVLINNAAYQGNDKLRTTKFENFPLEAWNQG